MGLVKVLWVVGGENSSHRGEEWAKLYVFGYDFHSLRRHSYNNWCANAKIVKGQCGSRSSIP